MIGTACVTRSTVRKWEQTYDPIKKCSDSPAMNKKWPDLYKSAHNSQDIRPSLVLGIMCSPPWIVQKPLSYSSRILNSIFRHIKVHVKISKKHDQYLSTFSHAVYAILPEWWMIFMIFLWFFNALVVDFEIQSLLSLKTASGPSCNIPIYSHHCKTSQSCSVHVLSSNHIYRRKIQIISFPNKFWIFLYCEYFWISHHNF